MSFSEYIYQLPALEYSFKLSQKEKINVALKEKGWVVVKSIATQIECSSIVNKQWNFIEDLGTGIERNNSDTWYVGGKWPGMISTGQILAPNVGHCSAVWQARQLPKVKTLFSNITNSPELMVSYDTMNMVRPYTLSSNRTKPLVPHLDQNPHADPDFVCYQGLLNLVDSNLEDGGTMLLSGSHKHFLEYKKYSTKNGGFHIRLEDVQFKKMVCPILKVGDFLLWDGRLVHGVAPPQKNKKDKKKSNYLRRSVIYISMVPSNIVNSDARKIRLKWFKEGVTTSHWVTKPKKKNINPRYPRKIPYVKKKYINPVLEDTSLIM
uniref:Phytanoyl-CoA dioxygenase n=1 Tax=Pithovirus LCPAC001 TaxID=2506585 RepID=A0A481Z4F8_9VIRU|nr:MAG: phytanoyl-CoA dioxygenase [Pithovirus LCPAC001]